jgi:hypothetical protein
MISLMDIGAVGKAVRVWLGSAVVSLLLALVVAALATYGIINTSAARIILVLAGLVSIAGIATSDYVCDKSRKHVAVVLLISTLVIGSGLFWLDTWATRKKAEMDAPVCQSRSTASKTYAGAEARIFYQAASKNKQRPHYSANRSEQHCADREQ